MDNPISSNTERNLELKKKELEIQLQEVELAEKRELLKAGSSKNAILKSPFSLTITTILGGLLGTAAGAVLQGYWNTQLERQKFESGIIQKVLEKGDEEEIKKSLLFYIDIGVITSLNKDSLRDIVNDEPNRLPSLKVRGPKGEEVNYRVNENGEVTFIDGWDSTFIKLTFIPQLTKVNLFGERKFSGNILFYEPAVQDLINAFKEIEETGKLSLIKSWDGSYVPRTLRGSQSRLSEHALGISFDINAKWNLLGSDPKKSGEEGSVLELVPIFKKHGFEWGGERNRRDPMHFVWVKFKEK
jgi:hypothetical protein